MDKYINRVLGIARTVGNITSMYVDEADKWNPQRIGIAGVTSDGEKFTIKLEIGDPKNEKEAAEYA
jgi:uncharacterized protein YlxP (DUF503 family)